MVDKWQDNTGNCNDTRGSQKVQGSRFKESLLSLWGNLLKKLLYFDFFAALIQYYFKKSCHTFFLDLRTENLILIMFSLRYLETLVLILFLTSLHIEAKPLRKRSISEVQLMHNVREHKQVGDRQDWLQEKLKGITVASVKPQHGQSGNIKNLFPNVVLGPHLRKG
uniref:parathyroid hormone 1b n=1 Tax=Epinephelus lanceolatus TaxID=310571 RepID=UPI00144705E2|nr:parathyroid hormone 1b [Epinephelus lanceolatus]